MEKITIKFYDENLDISIEDFNKILDLNDFCKEKDTIIDYSQFEFCKKKVFLEILDIIKNDKYLEFKKKITNEKVLDNIEIGNLILISGFIGNLKIIKIWIIVNLYHIYTSNYENERKNKKIIFKNIITKINIIQQINQIIKYNKDIIIELLSEVNILDYEYFIDEKLSEEASKLILETQRDKKIISKFLFINSSSKDIFSKILNMKNNYILEYILYNYDKKTDYNKIRIDPYIPSLNHEINLQGINKEYIKITPFFKLLLSYKYEKCDLLLEFNPEIINHVVSNIGLNLYKYKKNFFINALVGLILICNITPDDERFKYLIKRGISLNQEVGYIYNPLKDGLYCNKIKLKIFPSLLTAVYVNNIDMIRYLLSNGLEFDNSIDKISVIHTYFS